ncbi:MAG: heavy metal sensor histidine kinase [Caldimonas sp.]
MASRSISARLTIALSVLSVLVFTSVAVFLHHALSNELARTRAQDLAGRIDVVRHFLDEVQTETDIAALKHRLDDLLIGDGRLRIWVLGPAESVLYGGKRPPEVTQTSGGRVLISREDGLLLEGQRVALSSHPVLPLTALIVGLDIRAEQALLLRYRTIIAVVCGLGVALTVLLTAWIARRALEPLTRLSKEAAELTPQSLSIRLSQVETAELQMLVQAFNAALDRVQAAYSQLEGFNADVAHELRTPLATMIAATEVMLQRNRSADQLRETLQLNLEVLREQAALVNDMLFLARADRGEMAVRRKVTNLRTEASEVADYFDPLVDEKKQKLIVEGDATAVCDPTLIRRALVNLVGNATRYTNANGRIVIGLSERAGLVRLSVRNSGSDIAPKALPHLFERFFRADAAREQGAGNHGLGLAIVRAIASMHRGRTYAESGDGWTEVGFEFPACLQTQVDAVALAAAVRMSRS